MHDTTKVKFFVLTWSVGELSSLLEAHTIVGR